MSECFLAPSYQNPSETGRDASLVISLGKVLSRLRLQLRDHGGATA